MNSVKMPTGKQLKYRGKVVALILIGIALNAIGTSAFCLPYNVLIGGATGIGRLIHVVLPINISTCILLANVALLLASLIFLGKRYAASIVLATFAFPLFLDIVDRFVDGRQLIKDPLLATLCAGALMGLGLGMVIRAGGSLGGSDVIPQILHKRLNASVSVAMYTIDCIILLAQCFMATMNEIALGILMVLVYTFVMNRILLSGGGRVQFMIFSNKSHEITDMIIEHGFGASILHGASGYMKENMDVVVTAVHARFLNEMKLAVLEIDEHAFMTVSDIRQINLPNEISPREIQEEAEH